MDALRDRIVRSLELFAGIRVAWFFGSQLTGRIGPESDLDIAVAYEHALDADAREALRRHVVVALSDSLGRLGERADVVDLDDCDSAVAFRAVSEGALLFARSDEDRVRAVARVARRYDDESPRRELFRRAAIAVSTGPGDDPPPPRNG
jgi:predicted nucleotidyltransferase